MTWLLRRHLLGAGLKLDALPLPQGEVVQIRPNLTLVNHWAHSGTTNCMTCSWRLTPLRSDTRVLSGPLNEGKRGSTSPS